MSKSLSIPTPVSVNWDDIEKLWHHAFYNELRVAPEEHALLMSEAPFTPQANREKSCQIMFETFNVPLFYSCLQQVLACYGSGRVTGLVVDSGAANTFAVGVYELYSLPYSIRQLDIGGSDLTQYLTQCLGAEGHSFTTTAELQVVKAIKEKLCYVSLDPIKEARSYSLGSLPSKEYELPDGNKCSVRSATFQVPEALFNPAMLGSSGTPLPAVVHDSIAQVEPSLQKELYNSVILCGGNTMFEHFGDRLTAELKKDVSHTVRVVASPERKYLPWIGGSILGSLSTFPKMCISKEEYDEVGPTLVHRKCLQ